MDKNSTIKLALDYISGSVKNAEKYSKENTPELLRQALIDANGGTTKLDMKSFRRNPALYEIIEAIIPAIIVDGFKGDEFLFNLVDYRNVALGNDIDFWAEDNSLFVVSDAAHGTSGIRRQRLDVGTKVNIATQLKAVKIYEEVSRLLAGRVDFNMFIDRVSKSMISEINNDIYAALDGITSSTTGLSSTYVRTGTFSEDTLLEIIDHVEAATGQAATIIGARSSLRKITSSVVSDEAKSDMYNAGFYGKFNGTPEIVVKQRHAIGSENFLVNTSKIWVIAANDKPIKVLDLGIGYMDDEKKADQTKEFMYTQEIGTGVICSSAMGAYALS